MKKQLTTLILTVSCALPVGASDYGSGWSQGYSTGYGRFNNGVGTVAPIPPAYSLPTLNDVANGRSDYDRGMLDGYGSGLGDSYYEQRPGYYGDD